MYKCSFCKRISPPGQPRLVHVVERVVRVNPLAIYNTATRREVQAEYPICASCRHALIEGVTPSQLFRVEVKKTRKRKPGAASGTDAKEAKAIKKAKEEAKKSVYRGKVILGGAVENPVKPLELVEFQKISERRSKNGRKHSRHSTGEGR